MDKNWLTELLRGFTSEKIGFVIGQIFYISKDYKGYFPERLVSNLHARWLMGANIAYRKNVFMACGGFDNFFIKYANEDSKMAILAITRGFTFNRSPNAIVYHQAMDWATKSLLRSARNASVWPLLKKKYKDHYLRFGPPIKWRLIINSEDYLYILTTPIFIPLLFARYLLYGERNLKFFFTKWPIYLFLRRCYIYKKAIRNRVIMF